MLHRFVWLKKVAQFAKESYSGLTAGVWNIREE